MLETIIKGRSMMVPLIICSVMALAVLIDRLWAFYENAKIDYRALRAQIRKLIKEGKIKEAALLCINTPGPVSAVLLAGLQAFMKLEKKTPETLRMTVAETMDDFALHSMNAVERRMWILATVGASAPLFGMTGTVTGMINSFGKLAETADPSHAAAGISEALITTAAGLLIALGAVIPYNLFSSIADRIALEIDEASSELIEVLTYELEHGRLKDTENGADINRT